MAEVKQDILNKSESLTEAVREHVVLERKLAVERAIAKTLHKWTRDKLRKTFGAWKSDHEQVRRQKEVEELRTAHENMRTELQELIHDEGPSLEELQQAMEAGAAERAAAEHALHVERVMRRAFLGKSKTTMRMSFGAWQDVVRRARRDAEMAQLKALQAAVAEAQSTAAEASAEARARMASEEAELQHLRAQQERAVVGETKEQLAKQRELRVERWVRRAIARWRQQRFASSWTTWCHLVSTARRAAEATRITQIVEGVNDLEHRMLEAQATMFHAAAEDAARRDEAVRAQQAASRTAAVEQALRRTLFRWNIGAMRGAMTAWRGLYEHERRAAAKERGESENVELRTAVLDEVLLEVERHQKAIGAAERERAVERAVRKSMVKWTLGSMRSVFSAWRGHHEGTRKQAQQLAQQESYVAMCEQVEGARREVELLLQAEHERKQQERQLHVCRRISRAGPDTLAEPRKSVNATLASLHDQIPCKLAEA